MAMKRCETIDIQKVHRFSRRRLVSLGSLQQRKGWDLLGVPEEVLTRRATNSLKGLDLVDVGMVLLDLKFAQIRT